MTAKDATLQQLLLVMTLVAIARNRRNYHACNDRRSLGAVFFSVACAEAM
jgi:hypothetical protein